MRAVWSSRERKAAEAAELLAGRLGLPAQTLEQLAENDRSSTGYLPPELFEPAVHAFYGEPLRSHRGWETAAAAQERIADALETVLARSPADGDVAIVSHGGVGTLLLCQAQGHGDPPRRGPAGPGPLVCVRPRQPAGAAGWRALQARRSTPAAPEAETARVQARMPYPGSPLDGRARRRPLPSRPRRARRRPRVRLAAQGYTCEASALAATLGPSPRTEPVTANQGRERVQGGLRRRQPPGIAAADHRQPAVGDDRPRAGHRRAVRADRDRRRRRRRAADRRSADPAPASRHERPAGPADDPRRRRRSTCARPSRRSCPRTSTRSC